MQRRDLEELTRDELIAQAERAGVPRPRTLTQAELIDEILSRSVRNERDRARARGFLGRARDLLARVVERGLHLPEAARALRGTSPDPWPPPPPPLPTVTLAEIYAAQGHFDRAIAVLDEVLAREPDHEAARALRARLAEQARRRGRRGVEQAPAGDEAAGAAPAASSAGEPQTEAGPAEETVSEENPPTPSVNEAGEPVAAADAEASAAPAAEEAAAPQEPAEAAQAAPQVIAEAAETAPHEIAEAAPQEPAEAAEAAPQEIAEAAPEAPAGLAEEEPEPLPERYEVDEIVGMAVDPETLYLYWEVQPTTLARARAHRPDGHLVIRMIAVLPTWEGPMMERRDIAVDALFGDRFVREIPAGANVRLSIGWLVADGFEPFAVGLEIAAPRAIRSGEPPRPPAWLGEAGGAPHGAAGRDAAKGAPGPASGADAATGAATAPVSAGARAAAPASGAAGAPGSAAEAMAEGSGGPERFPWGITPTEEAVARAVAASRGGASELARPPGPGGADHGAPIVESWSQRGGASELTRPGGASELARAGGLPRSNGSPPIESWFVSAGAAERHG